MDYVKLTKRAAVVSALAASLILPNQAMACSSQPYLAGMCAFGGNFAIRGWARTDGQLIDISSNAAVFSLLGTTYGGDGRTTFGLPDLRGRSAIGAGRGDGLQDYRLGQRGGAETHTLTLAQMPSHNHSASTTVTNATDSSASTATLRALAAGASTNMPIGAVLANNPNRENIYSGSAPTVDMSAEAIALNVSADVTSTATTTVNNNGSGQSFNIRGPYLTVTWLIALQGIFPSRS